jgi:hypothetical protein
MGMGRDGTPGSAGLHLATGVPLLHPDEQVFAAMLEGWRAQQLARNLAPATAGRREAMVRSFAVHADAMRLRRALGAELAGWRIHVAHIQPSSPAAQWPCF